MMSNNSARSGRRTLFFGMPCAFSAIVLASLRTDELELVGIVSPDHSRAPEHRAMSTVKPFLPLHQQSSDQIDTVPRFAVRSLRDRIVKETLIATEPDLIIVACFPRKLPLSIIAAARVAAVNVHPSLLPRWRGPDPLFWTFQAGDTSSGFTLHLIDDGFDTGPILALRPVAVAAGEALADLDRRLATLGGAMLVDLARSLPALPPARPQDDALATQAPVPTTTDRTIDPSWTRDRARGFIAGVSSSHGPLFYRAADNTVRPIIAVGTGGRDEQIELSDGLLAVTLGSAKPTAKH